MTRGTDTPPNGTWRGAAEEETARRLIHEAGPRTPLPEEDLDAIRAVARAQWRERYGAPARPAPRRIAWMPVAAALVATAIGLAWWARVTLRPSPFAGPPAASIEAVDGIVRAKAGGSAAAAVPASAGAPIAAGTNLETEPSPEGPGRVALRMGGGASVRLDVGTRAHIESPTVIALARGAVYVDTGSGDSRGDEIAVRLPAGLFQGIGTQFEVRAGGAGAEALLRVREGSVRLKRGRESVTTPAGSELVVRGDGTLLRRAGASHGPEWEWVVRTAPKLAIEGVTVRRFLDWAAREAGWRVEFADAEAARLADTVVLHGSIAHLTPTEATGVVLSSSGLAHSVVDGALVVGTALRVNEAGRP